MTSQSLVSKPSLIEWGKVKFLIMDAPKETNLHLYLKECKKNNVIHIVRISEPTYNKDEIEKAGITLHVSFGIHITHFSNFILPGDVLS
jgi:protein tyrosine phosphatase type 4A